MINQDRQYNDQRKPNKTANNEQRNPIKTQTLIHVPLKGGSSYSTNDTVVLSRIQC
jgi:hypothetical protein